MDYEPRKLAEALVEKHDRFISEKSDEIERMQQAVMLREKRDQLLHWMQENGSKDTFEKELEETERELNHVQGSYTVKDPGHYKNLKDNIDEHKNARDYWLGRMGELTT